jgi:ATP-dependent Clp protease ATP-binding subunit ClpX
LVKQYQKLLSYENVELVFTDEALRSIAQQSLQRKTGARGLRSVIETAMMDVMYEIPSMKGIEKCIIDKEVITEGKAPSYRLKTDDDTDSLSEKKIKEESA